jgi:hypothetical protein
LKIEKHKSQNLITKFNYKFNCALKMQNIQEIELLFNDNNINNTFLLNFCKKHGIQFKYQDNNIDRIIFYVNNKIAKPDIINTNCNGMIMERTLNDGWKIVCRPMPAFQATSQITINNQFNNQFNNQLNLFPVYETTIINVYWSVLKNKWCFGTKKAFDISMYVWRGVDYNLILQRFFNTDGGIDVEKLERGKTYIYAFAVPELHIFTKQTFINHIGTHDGELECYGQIEHNFTLEEIKQQNASALEKFYESQVKFFGYIVRGAEGSFLLESTLLRKINYLVYKPQFHKDKELRLQFFKYNADIFYVIARCYVSEKTKKTLLLFPEFETHLERCRQIDREFREFCEHVIKKKELPEHTVFKLIYQKYAYKLHNIKSVKTFMKSGLYRNPKFYHDMLKY